MNYHSRSAHLLDIYSQLLPSVLLYEKNTPPVHIIWLVILTLLSIKSLTIIKKKKNTLVVCGTIPFILHLTIHLQGEALKPTAAMSSSQTLAPKGILCFCDHVGVLHEASLEVLMEYSTMSSSLMKKDHVISLDADESFNIGNELCSCGGTCAPGLGCNKPLLL
ncbi:hypothetical protein F5Y02DRAFT_185615 [Annulohypoxylon stygium]|nr:hypothetical protein F5Y02DRAFT_185615 [Annulohypoxylon stygium]